MATKTHSRKRKKRQTSSLVSTLMVLAAVFVLLVTANTVYPFSSSIPNWNQLKEEVTEYFDDADKAVNYVDGEISVHYIDVGQGNCILIKAKDQAILVDAGERDQGQKVVDYLHSQQITHLDYVVASHPHSDHIGGLSMVLSEVDTDSIIMPQLKDSLVPTTRVYEDLLDAISSQGVEVLSAHVGDTYEVGGGVLTILGPSGDFDDLNDMSVGVKFTYGETSFLSTGDMEKKAETALLGYQQDLSADVYLMGHHGSATSNSEELLDAIKASYYVIECGYQNEYGHPHKEAIERAQQRGGTVYRCDLVGTVVFVSDGSSLTVQTEKGG
jgi:competence protein ComEC